MTFEGHTAAQLDYPIPASENPATQSSDFWATTPFECYASSTDNVFTNTHRNGRYDLRMRLPPDINPPLKIFQEYSPPCFPVSCTLSMVLPMLRNFDTGQEIDFSRTPSIQRKLRIISRTQRDIELFEKGQLK